MGEPAGPDWRQPMQRALQEAERAAAHGDVPIGAVLLNPAGGIVSAAGNERELAADPTAHAEVLAIREAAAQLGSWHLDDHTLVVTLEPCTMCAGALVQARIGRLVFGAYDPKAGAVASLWDVVRDPRLNHRVQVVGGISEQECGRLIRDFFDERR
jgi:tRNA(adenine34) deaminase